MGFVVTMDGPAGAGKSTVARALARDLGWRFLDTGALYRALTLAAIEGGVAIDDGAGLATLAAKADIRQGDEGRTYLGDRDVSGDIRSEAVTSRVSAVSAHPEVRSALLDVQRRAAIDADLVCEGRDMGTVVFPDAGLKLYLDADAATRARRRLRDLERQGEVVALEELERRIRERDRSDATRAAAPLRRAPDQIYLDTSGLGFDAVLAQVKEAVADRLRRRGSPR